MKRLALILLLLAAVAATAACGGGAPVQAETEPGSLSGAKVMVTPWPTDNPEILDGLESMMTEQAYTPTPELSTPTLQPPETATDPWSGGKSLHTVVEGETLWSIALAESCTVEAIAKANLQYFPDPTNQDSLGKISIGWELIIPTTCN